MEADHRSALAKAETQTKMLQRRADVSLLTSKRCLSLHTCMFYTVSNCSASTCGKTKVLNLKLALPPPSKKDAHTPRHPKMLPILAELYHTLGFLFAIMHGVNVDPQLSFLSVTFFGTTELLRLQSGHDVRFPSAICCICCMRVSTPQSIFVLVPVDCMRHLCAPHI
jgi:hypothetical protein